MRPIDLQLAAASSSQDDVAKGREHKPNHKHGMWGRPEYRVWAEMIQRCHRPGRANYKNYGARGIAVCEEWRASFAAFMRDMGPRPEGKSARGRALFSIERLDNNAGYSRANCVWATAETQANNRRPKSGNRAKREPGPLAQAARIAGVTEEAIRYRLKQGMTLEQAIAKPRDNRGRPKKAA